MLFTSITFVIFFTLFYFLYWFFFNRSLKLQNLLILTGSYVFYAWWDWRFLLLLIASSLLNYFLGIGMFNSKQEKFRTILLWIGLLQGLGSLLFFKYFNFFVKSIVTSFNAFHIRPDIYTLNIILPLGISFYTFRTLSYLLDIKHGKIKPSTDWMVFFCYVSFFPCVISGPIDRPKTLIPQLAKKRVFDYTQATDGMRQILWGLFKKIVIADNCAVFTNDIFEHYKTLPASSLLFGAFLSLIQVYADFSGYSDIAIGLSNLMGFKITRNFNTPFFAQNMADFWRRWHISLTSWLTDYVFTPLSIYLRNLGKTGLILAIVTNFMAIGIWHGANWTFILFGFLNGCYYIPLILRGTFNKQKKIVTRKPLPALLNMAATFILIMFTFILFRADSLAQAFDYYQRLFSRSLFSAPVIIEKVNTAATLVCMVIMFGAEWLQRDKQHALQIDCIKKFPVRAIIYYSLILIILTFTATRHTDFIYFKF
ncbi:MBOAT family protein [Mucilaginibacter sp. SG564]|uniref:MBOAT family O-acyltransferase n=1 Tax=Mucilaginibacter sp. SG564 TaxID=2587022 RepID=UPI001552B1F9|nr:MBOAT family protein [Mucilaginibacter sp. SG564]NOW94987.1 D-alanyl-lipoteichoic acid acyltransferase DltB (MBOAT superfamily) [Mucilaginibacter sp. SG564]